MKKILITCDTEIGEISKDMDNAFDIFVNGHIKNERVGVPLINKIASEYNVVINHFVDVYPKRYEKEFAILSEDICKSGHSIGLHTHPSTIKNNGRYMWQYNEEEQKEIIDIGKIKLYNWLGYEVMAHRSGGYGSDNKLFNILKSQGIKYDYSYFIHNEACKINYHHINAIDIIQGVWEVPVTVYKEEKKLLNSNYFSKVNYKKLDFRYGSNVKTILNVIRWMPDNSVIVLFLHSFNFLGLEYNKKYKKFSKIYVRYDLIEAFYELLEGISKMNDCQSKSINDIDLYKKTNDYCVNIQKRIGLKNYILNRLNNFNNIIEV